MLSLNNISIEIRQSVGLKYLDIPLNLTLNFTSHIQINERRVFSAIEILCRLKSLARIEILLSVYYAITICIDSRCSGTKVRE